MAQIEPNVLIRSTGKLYLHALRTAAQGFKKNAHLLPAQLLLSIVGALIAPWTMLFGQLPGGLLLGLLQAVLVAAYMAMVEAAVRGTSLSYGEIWSHTQALIGPAISVFFLIFIASFLLSGIAADAAQILFPLFLLACTALIEGIYIHRGVTPDSFSFLRENFPEWLIALLLCGLPLAPLVVAWKIPVLVLFILLVNPLVPYGLPALLISGMGAVESSFVQFALTLIFLFLFLIFRGCLYVELSRTGRRGRIYKERFA